MHTNYNKLNNINVHIDISIRLNVINNLYEK